MAVWWESVESGPPLVGALGAAGRQAGSLSAGPGSWPGWLAHSPEHKGSLAPCGCNSAEWEYVCCSLCVCVCGIYVCENASMHVECQKWEKMADIP